MPGSTSGPPVDPIPTRWRPSTPRPAGWSTLLCHSWPPSRGRPSGAGSDWPWPPTSGSVRRPSRFAANFARLGFHQGFGISITLPAVVGGQRALELLTTGRRVDGTEALAMGLCDRLDDDPRAGAHRLGRRDRRIGAPGRPGHPGHAPGRRRRAVHRRGGARTGRATAVDGPADFREGIAASQARRDPDSGGSGRPPQLTAGTGR